jgi:RES domain-containing protein
MIVFRIGKEQYSKDLSGNGAKLYGGRWNLPGTSCLYTSQSRALALLEYSANVGMDFIPPNLCFTLIEIADDLIDEIAVENIPKDWNAVPSSSSTKVFGSAKFTQSSLPILKVPSVIIPNEYNFIINPTFLDTNLLKIITIEKYTYDFRIKG